MRCFIGLVLSRLPAAVDDSSDDVGFLRISEGAFLDGFFDFPNRGIDALLDAGL